MDGLIQGSVAPTHDLIRLSEPTALTSDGPVPSWVATTLEQIPWVVVRRGFIRNGMIPIGVRGAARNQRFGAFVSAAQIAERLAPEDLLLRATESQHGEAVPAMTALARVVPVLARHGARWGPGGSVGFEIATGAATATPSSDLDLIVRQHHRLEPKKAIELLAALANAAAPARIDVMLETPSGGVSLAEIAAMPPQLLVRTPYGPRLLLDPWMVDPTVPLEVAS
jgi:phosphoribosyl-dephospho-CoA transferase